MGEVGSRSTNFGRSATAALVDGGCGPGLIPGVRRSKLSAGAVTFGRQPAQLNGGHRSDANLIEGDWQPALAFGNRNLSHHHLGKTLRERRGAPRLGKA